MKIPTDPDEILASLSDLSASIRDGLDAGTLEVRRFFERRSRDQRKPVKINNPVATNIMRYVALNHVHANRKIGAEYHLEEMEQRLLYEEAAFAADIRGKAPPVDLKLNGNGKKTVNYTKIGDQLELELWS